MNTTTNSMTAGQWAAWAAQATAGAISATMERAAEVAANLANPAETRRAAEGVISALRAEVSERKEAAAARRYA